MKSKEARDRRHRQKESPLEQVDEPVVTMDELQQELLLEVAGVTVAYSPIIESETKTSFEQEVVEMSEATQQTTQSAAAPAVDNTQKQAVSPPAVAASTVEPKIAKAMDTVISNAQATQPAAGEAAPEPNAAPEATNAQAVTPPAPCGLTEEQKNKQNKDIGVLKRDITRLQKAIDKCESVDAKALLVNALDQVKKDHQMDLLSYKDPSFWERMKEWSWKAWVAFVGAIVVAIAAVWYLFFREDYRPAI